MSAEPWIVYACPVCGKQLCRGTESCVDGHPNTHSVEVEVVPAERVEKAELAAGDLRVELTLMTKDRDALKASNERLEEITKRADESSARSRLAEQAVKEQLSQLRQSIEGEVARLREIQAQSGVAEATADRLDEALKAGEGS